MKICMQLNQYCFKYWNFSNTSFQESQDLCMYYRGVKCCLNTDGIMPLNWQACSTLIWQYLQISSQIYIYKLKNFAFFIKWVYRNLFLALKQKQVLNKGTQTKKLAVHCINKLQQKFKFWKSLLWQNKTWTINSMSNFNSSYLFCSY